jgi:ribosome recycling factor
MRGMDSAYRTSRKRIVKNQSGKASPAMLDSVRVEYYGVVSPISQVANVENT